MSSAEYGFVYIHGAGLDNWIWDDLTQLQNTPNLLASFPGRNSDLAVRERLGLKAYVDHVCRQIENCRIDNVIIVSHSIGGLVGLEAASEVPDQVNGFVGLCAVFPPIDDSFVSCFPFHQRVIQEIIIRTIGTKPPDSAIRGSLCAGLSEEYTRRIIAQFTPESPKLFTGRRTAAIPDIPTLYIRTTADKELSSSLQETMSANISADEVVTIESGHMPMLSNPEDLASILDEFKENRIS